MADRRTAETGAQQSARALIGNSRFPYSADLHHHDLRPGKPPEGQLDGCEGNEGGLDYPAARQDDEAFHVVAPLDDLHAQQRHLCHRRVNLPGVVAAIGPDQFEPREAPAYLVEHQPRAVAVLDRGRVDNHPHRQSLGIDQGVDFAAFHLLASVVTHLVVSAAPFSADFNDWLSITAADGLASRPIRSRSAMCSSAQIASQVPSRWNLRKML